MQNKQKKIDISEKDEFEKLKEVIEETGWGIIDNIVVKNGKPKMVRIVKEIKLD